MARKFKNISFAMSLLMCVFSLHATVLSTVEASNDTSIEFTLFLHGVGKGGDSVNPLATMTDTPKIRTKDVTVTTVYEMTNASVTRTGTVHYDSESGSFKGTIIFPQLVEGNYTFKIKVPSYLDTVITSIPYTTTMNSSLKLPALALWAGDINNNNALDVQDYALLIECYRYTCSENENVSRDITGDGRVNQYDYNLFLRELSQFSRL